MLAMVEVIRPIDNIELRMADTREVLAMGLTAQEAVEQSITASLRAFAVSWKGVPLLWWGYAPISVAGGVCIAWMLTTPLADKINPLVVGLGSKRAVAYLLGLYPKVVVHTDPRYEVAVKWLEWLGFRPVGPVGQLLEMQAERV